MRTILLAPAALALALATGCTVNLGEAAATTVERAKVEQQISRQLAPKLGAAPQSVTCPDDLKGKIGATLQCKLVTAAGEPQDVTVTVTSVEGDTVNFDIKAVPSSTPSSTVPSAPTTAPVVERDVLEPRIVELLTPQLGARPNYASCPENLRGEVGVTLQCQLVDGDGLERQVLVTVTSVVGTTVNFNLKLIS